MIHHHRLIRRLFHLSLWTVFYLWMASGAYSLENIWEKVGRFEGVDLYRSLTETDGRLPFKAVADLDIPYQSIVMALVDAEHKPDWAPKLTSTRIHHVISPNCFEYSEYYETPWPFKDREFLLLGTVNYLSDRVVFEAKNSTHPNLADPDHVRANIEVLTFEIIPLSETGTRVSFVFSGDMGGLIPPFVKTIIQKKWPVRFIQALKHRIDSQQAIETERYLALKKTPITLPSTIDESPFASEVIQR